jgi:hypothetical protein
MKSDTTTTALNIVLAMLVVLGVVFAAISVKRARELRQLQVRAQVGQLDLMRAQALANDVAAYNATAKSPELTQILLSVRAPQQAAAKK